MKNNTDKGIVITILNARLAGCYLNLKKTILEDNLCYNDSNDVKRLEYLSKSRVLIKENQTFFEKLATYPKYFPCEGFVLMVEDMYFVKSINKSNYCSHRFVIMSLEKFNEYKKIELEFRYKIFLQFRKAMKPFRIDVAIEDFDSLFCSEKFSNNFV